MKTIEIVSVVLALILVLVLILYLRSILKRGRLEEKFNFLVKLIKNKSDGHFSNFFYLVDEMDIQTLESLRANILDFYGQNFKSWAFHDYVSELFGINNYTSLKNEKKRELALDFYKSALSRQTPAFLANVFAQAVYRQVFTTGAYENKAGLSEEWEFRDFLANLIKANYEDDFPYKHTAKGKFFQNFDAALANILLEKNNYQSDRIEVLKSEVKKIYSALEFPNFYDRLEWALEKVKPVG